MSGVSLTRPSGWPSAQLRMDLADGLVLIGSDYKRQIVVMEIIVLNLV